MGMLMKPLLFYALFKQDQLATQRSAILFHRQGHCMNNKGAPLQLTDK